MNEIQKQISKIIKSLILVLSVGIGGAIVVAIFVGVAVALGRGKAISPMVIVAGFLALAWLGVLIWAFVMYLSGLRGFGKRLDEIGSRAMQDAFWANLIPLLGSVVFIPILILSPYIGIAVYGLILGFTIVLYLRGYLMLPRSTSLNELGVKGANMLKMAMILNVSSSVVGLIYYVTTLPSTLSMTPAMVMSTSGGMMVLMTLLYVVMFVLSILSLIFTFMGWSTIRKSFAQ